MPAGASKANPAPMVVLPHGGPWTRYSWGFDGEVQFLVSRGYAVLQPNYRGSNGYSWMFPEQDKWDFVKMHEDGTDATKGIIAAGLVDRDRVAIIGGSWRLACHPPAWRMNHRSIEARSPSPLCSIGSNTSRGRGMISMILSLTAIS